MKHHRKRVRRARRRGFRGRPQGSAASRGGATFSVAASEKPRGPLTGSARSVPGGAVPAEPPNLDAMVSALLEAEAEAAEAEAHAIAEASAHVEALGLPVLPEMPGEPEAAGGEPEDEA